MKLFTLTTKATLNKAAPKDIQFSWTALSVNNPEISSGNASTSGQTN